MLGRLRQSTPRRHRWTLRGTARSTWRSWMPLELALQRPCRPVGETRSGFSSARDRDTDDPPSKRRKGLEPSTFCMASRRRVTRRAGLRPANCAKRPVQPRRVPSRISPRFAGVLSTNCPPADIRRASPSISHSAVSRAPARRGTGSCSPPTPPSTGAGRMAALRRRARKSTREAIRCLKRYLARHVWRLLQPPHPAQGKLSPSIS